MANYSNYLANKIINYIRGTAIGSVPSTFAALHDGSPTKTGAGGTERTTTVRPGGRPAVSFGAYAGGKIVTNAVVNYGDADASTSVTHQSVWDAASAGNMLMFGQLPGSPISITEGNTVTVPSGQMEFSTNGDLSEIYISRALGWVAGTAPPAAPSAVYMALYNGNPTSGGTEVTATIRPAGRLAVTLDAPTNGDTANTAEVDFGLADAGATINYVAVMDAASGGNVVLFKAISSRTIATGEGVRFAAGSITFSIQ